MTIIIALTNKLIAEGYVPVEEKLETRGNILVHGIPGMSNLRLGNLPFTLYNKDEAGIRLTGDRGELMKEASCILSSSFPELDTDLREPLQTLLGIPCWPVGPMLPNAVLDEDEKHKLPAFKFGDMKEDRDCLSWLDKQEPHSVLYISFGSLAEGLESTAVKFLWVIRPGLAEGALTESEKFSNFLVRTANSGKIISWAPQLQVLAHPSTALFLTHCGWNSTMESIWNGVPMLVWPCFAEQNLNAKYIVEEWRIGAPFNMNTLVRPGSLVTSEEIERTIRSSMNDSSLRERTADLSKAARTSARKGGSSYENLKKFVQAVKSGSLDSCRKS